MDKIKAVGVALLKALTSKPAIVAIILTVAGTVGIQVAPESAAKIAETLAGLADLLTGADVVVVE